MSQIEQGRIAWPNADIRRRLAAALGVSHLDLLVAAGEINADEIASAGAVGVVEQEEDSPAARIYAAAKQARWSGDREKLVIGMLATLSDWPETQKKETQ